MVGTIGSAEIKTKYPVTKGLVAGTTSQEGNIENLEAEVVLKPSEHWGSI